MKKKKPAISEESDYDSDLARLLGEAEKPSRSYPSNNNGSSNEVITVGFYFKYHGVYVFNRHYGNDGLEEQDVKRIAGQLEKVCKGCAFSVKEDYVLVKTNEERFYVHIDDIGMVRLPELVVSNPKAPRTQRVYGKTDDPNKVLGLVKKTKQSK